MTIATVSRPDDHLPTSLETLSEKPDLDLGRGGVHSSSRDEHSLTLSLTREEWSVAMDTGEDLLSMKKRKRYGDW